VQLACGFESGLSSPPIFISCVWFVSSSQIVRLKFRETKCMALSWLHCLRHRCGEYRQAQLHLTSSEISFVKSFGRSEMLSPIEGKKPAAKKAAKSESSIGEKNGKGLLVPIGGTVPFSRVMNSRGCAPATRLPHAIAAGQPSRPEDAREPLPNGLETAK
jgi:hypothetical protein